MNIELETEKLDDKLEKIVKKIGVENYQKFVENSCDELKAYETLMTNIQYNLLPKDMLNFLDEKTIKILNKTIDDKIKELNLD